MVKLRRIFESTLYLESQKDLDDLKAHLGQSLYDDYMKIRNKIPKDQNQYRDFQKLKSLPIKDVQSYIDNFQSNVDRIKEAKKGARKLYEDEDWIVYRITTYPASSYYGKDTKWCISGGFQGYEERGEKFFNEYIDTYDLDGGYYFYLSKHNPREKYCVLQNSDGEVESIWDSTDAFRGNTDLDLEVDLPVIPEVNLIRVQDKELKNRLISAVKGNDLNGVKQALREGAEPDTIDRYGDPILKEAVERGFVDIAEYLLQNGATTGRRSDGLYDIEVAVKQKDLPMVTLLLPYTKLTNSQLSKLLYQSDKNGTEAITDLLREYRYD